MTNDQYRTLLYGAPYGLDGECDYRGRSERQARRHAQGLHAGQSANVYWGETLIARYTYDYHTRRALEVLI